MRDGQGLEVSNAHAEAIGAIDLLRTEWLAFGKRLPEVMRGLGKSVTEFKKGINDNSDENDSTKS